MDLFTKQKQTHRHRKLMITKEDSREVGGKRDKLGVWDSHIRTNIYGVDNQQSTALETILNIL